MLFILSIIKLRYMVECDHLQLLITTAQFIFDNLIVPTEYDVLL